MLPLLALAGCPQQPPAPAQEQPAVEPKVAQEPKPRKPQPPPPPPMERPVPLWEQGKIVKDVDAAAASLNGFVILDLGDSWTPYLFTNGVREDGKPLPNAYRKTYLELAAGRFPDDHHGERASDDKYLELYGIMPTLTVLRERSRQTAKLKCADELDLQPLIDFKGLVTYKSNNEAKRQAGDFVYLRNSVKRMLRKQKIEDPEQLEWDRLDDRDKARLRRYRKVAPAWYAVDAAQKRLKCEGYFKTRGRYVRGAMDWPTHDALAEFERRHRVYSWGYIGRDTLEYLRISPTEAERRAVIRVLTERAIHAMGILEDGSMSLRKDGKPRTYVGADGQQHPMRDLASEIRESLIEAFGLQTPESTMAWLEAITKLPVQQLAGPAVADQGAAEGVPQDQAQADKPAKSAKDHHQFVAVRAIDLPEYYDGVMPLTLEYDRGDVWYDFPYDEQGRQLAQPVHRRPRVTVYTRYLDKRIPLARFGTTIGGWRSELIGETVMWKYKDSPIGPRVWQRIVASPVWLPPDGTPPRDLLTRNRKRKKGEPEYMVNYHETGPSYASAYGLVAAYHRKFDRRGEEILIGGDEGIRTHGSVDYMSIMRRHSHGCHRLHNHIAVRLMSFVLAHRPHRRLGQQPLSFSKVLEYKEDTYNLDIKRGGYIFELAEPLQVKVHEGRIRGKQKEPIAFPVPKFDDEIGAYVHPDGGAVAVRRGKLVEVPMPVPDAGVIDEILGTALPPQM